MDFGELGKKPISDANPAGEDVKYEPEFDELQHEIDKMSIASSEGGGINWDKVIELSSGILGEKSKNILVASYLGAALTETRALDGFSIGLNVLKDLVENFWDNMYPPKKRIRGRLNAVTWWMDRGEAFFKEFSPDPLPPATVDAVKENLSALDSILSEKSEDAPMVGRLSEYLNRLPLLEEEAPAEESPAADSAPAETAAGPAAAAETTAPETPAAAEAAKAEKAAPAPAQPAAPVRAAAPLPAGEDIKTPQDLDNMLKSGLEQLGLAADFMMKQDASNPLSYRITRFVAWLTVDRLPMSDGNQTHIAPPDSAIRNAIENLMSGRDYMSAIEACESRIPEFLFWLDLSRITAQALDALGGRYQDAVDALVAETVLFVKRLPGIENMTFSDGLPFADKETRSWLKNISFGDGSDASAMIGGGAGLQAEVADVYSQAQKLVKDKKTIDAIRLIETRLNSGGSGKARLTWRIALSRLLLSSTRPELARPHLDEILAEMGAVNLEMWDPDLALRALTVVYQGLADEENGDNAIKAQNALDRIARISPAEALHLFKG